MIHVEKEGFTIRNNTVGGDSTGSIIKDEKQNKQT
jgi:hypothetical protein